MKRRGAIELSIGTIVIVVLSMSMLILGLVLINKIMCSAINGINAIDEKMMDEMRSIFGAHKKIILKHQENVVYKGLRDGYGVAFGVINLGSSNPEFSYEIAVSDIGNCKISESRALDLIILGKQGKMAIPSGEDYFDLIKFNIPNDVMPCELKYEILVKNGGEVYASAPLNIVIKEKPFTRSFCS
jgi:hypothetical protein